MADRLRAILDDLGREDSTLMGEVAAGVLRGEAVDSATTRARAGVLHAFLREVRPIVARMAARGDAPAEIRRRLLAACDGPGMKDEHRPTFRAAVARALDAELGPAAG